MENKRSYFEFQVEIPLGIHPDKIETVINSKVDLVLASMSATSNVYKYKKKNKIIYLFETNTRKRKGQLDKMAYHHLLSESKLIDGFYSSPLLKREFIGRRSELDRGEKIIALSKPDIFDGYNGEDVKLFDDKNNWRPWQKELYEEIFTKTDQIKEPDPRRIISLIDKIGNTGKSSFFKYLYFKHPEEIGRISYGTASQLRSSLINIGNKKIYIVDLTRSKSQYDKQEDLLSAIEDLKSGLVISSMYGAGKDLLMNPPHVIISSNYLFKLELLSMDRWKIYEVTKDYKLSDVTKETKRSKRKKVEPVLGKS